MFCSVFIFRGQMHIWDFSCPATSHVENILILNCCHNHILWLWQDAFLIILSYFYTWYRKKQNKTLPIVKTTKSFAMNCWCIFNHSLHCSLPFLAFFLLSPSSSSLPSLSSSSSLPDTAAAFGFRPLFLGGVFFFLFAFLPVAKSESLLLSSSSSSELSDGSG